MVKALKEAYHTPSNGDSVHESEQEEKEDEEEQEDEENVKDEEDEEKKEDEDKQNTGDDGIKEDVVGNEKEWDEGKAVNYWSQMTLSQSKKNEKTYR